MERLDKQQQRSKMSHKIAIIPSILQWRRPRPAIRPPPCAPMGPQSLVHPKPRLDGLEHSRSSQRCTSHWATDDQPATSAMSSFPSPKSCKHHVLPRPGLYPSAITLSSLSPAPCMRSPSSRALCPWLGWLLWLSCCNHYRYRP